MNKFGFTISQPRSLNYDSFNRDKVETLLQRIPSYKACMSCGGCTSTCSAGQFTDFNIRRIHTQFSRGNYEGLEKQLHKCMLCGKCTLVCPRGVNTRALIIEMRRLLND